MKLLVLALFTFACSAFSAWSTPAPAPIVFYNVGCGADSGKVILITDFTPGGTASMVLKSTSPIFSQATSVLERSVADQIPVQIFTRLSNSTVDFSYVGDDGTCKTKSWTEIIGVALDKK